MVCEQRWSNSNNLLTYLSFLVLDLINEAPSHQLHLEEVKKEFDDSKELTQQISQLTVQEIEKWMKAPNSSITRIKVLIKQWKKMRQEEISSKICKAEIQLRNAHFQEVDEILELFGKWCSTLKDK